MPVLKTTVFAVLSRPCVMFIVTELGKLVKFEHIPFRVVATLQCLIRTEEADFTHIGGNFSLVKLSIVYCQC